MPRFVVELEQRTVVRREVFVEAASEGDAVRLAKAAPEGWPVKREDDVGVRPWKVVDSWEEGAGYGEG